MHSKNKLLSILLTLAMLAGFLPWATLSARAEVGNSWSGEINVTENTTIADADVTVEGDTILSIAAGKTLTITSHSITIAENKTLTVAGPGTLTVKAAADNSAIRINSGGYIGTKLVVIGGIVNATGGTASDGYGGAGIYCRTVEITGGSVNVTGGSGGKSWGGGDGVSCTSLAVSGSGSLTATGGDGGKGGNSGDGDGGKGGEGVYCAGGDNSGVRVRVSGSGSLTATGGKGGESGESGIGGTGGTGLYSSDGVTVSDSGSLTATGGNGGNGYYGGSGGDGAKGSDSFAVNGGRVKLCGGTRGDERGDSYDRNDGRACIDTTFRSGSGVTAEESDDDSAYALLASSAEHSNKRYLRFRGPSLAGGVTVSANSLLVCATYEGGKMVSVQIAEITDSRIEADAAKLLNLQTLPANCKLFLLNKETYAPLCEAWSNAND